VVGWFDGRSESGPRALGHRSILASPFAKGIKDHLNKDIKKREAFRPYGCIVPHRHSQTYFEVPSDFDGPFMSYAPKVKPEWRAEFKEVLHPDQTLRIQTLRQNHNPRLYKLIQVFAEGAKAPLLINTSLNIMGEPLVETVAQAKHFFETVPIEGMMIGDVFIER
jgi:carbamoyltransferase